MRRSVMHRPTGRALSSSSWPYSLWAFQGHRYRPLPISPGPALLNHQVAHSGSRHFLYFLTCRVYHMELGKEEIALLAVFVMFANHINYDGHGDHERPINALGNINGVAVAEERELAANLRQQV